MKLARQNTVFKDAYNRCLALVDENLELPSEPELAARLEISRTTVRSVLQRLHKTGIIDWNKRAKVPKRRPELSDYFPESETVPLSEVIERTFMRKILSESTRAGSQINELELAREIGVGTSAVREYLIRFSRFGLIEKRPNSHWILKGLTREFALELAEVREMFELRSAMRFVQLPPTSEVWAELDRIELAHKELLATIQDRWQDFSELDERFHRLIHRASLNRFIVDFYDVIAMIFHYHYQWNKTGEKQRNTVAVREHLDYIAALKQRDADGVEVSCRVHLRSARATLLASIIAEG
jgi:DNA-binding GntR family transcriptional regulator